MAGYDEGTINPTPLDREGDKATSRPVPDITDLLATIVDAWQVHASGCFHKASRVLP